MKLYVIRHGETTWNVEKRLQGRSDTRLNEYGIELAKITAHALKDINFDLIYSSPLKRAYDTAKIIRDDRKIEIHKDDRLQEICFGDWEGVKSSELPEEFALFFDAPEKYIPLGNGESFTEVIERTRSFIEEIVVPASEKYQCMLIVAHGALNNAIAANLLNREIKDYWEGVFPKNCSASIYEINGHNYNLLDYGKVYYEVKNESNSWK